MNDLPPNLSPYSLASQTIENHPFFFSGATPLSNFHQHKFTLDGIDYDNSEMYIQAMKARMFGDNHTLNRILSAKTTGEMKALGTKVKKFNPEVWAQFVTDIAINCLHAKFTQNKKKSPNNKLWGIGISMFDPMIMTKQSLWGENVQVKALMQVRKTIKEASSSQNTTSNISKQKSCSQVVNGQPNTPPYNSN